MPEPGADLWLGGRLRLIQPPRGAHRAGTDAVLLAGLLAPEPGAVVCDVGAASGAVGLAVALRSPDCRVVLVERDPDLAAYARCNAEANGLVNRTTVIEADVLAPGLRRQADGLTPGLADLLLTNPPYFEPGRHQPSPVIGKASAHTFSDGGIEAWMRSCVDLLRPQGRLGLIHRADHLPACLDAARGRFGALAIRPVHAKRNQPAIRILMSGVKGSRAPLRLLPPVVLHDDEGRFTPHAAALHEGRGWVDAGVEVP
ncbi:methyltransferase [Methylobacterium sp. Leaf94]|uniref:tRNA1(Val) (adenine(37)-N6)-methyltransferase n=1 Tax=Methylobacterium sp. Leaf94 TaxID=1736250 RepID=UPI0006F8735C|nr:methyltransferase [Methylobacterium sp. Leaf94]KQU35135.1 methyltransferase [Methylobacterium sp. Leaf94]